MFLIFKFEKRPLYKYNEIIININHKSIVNCVKKVKNYLHRMTLIKLKSNFPLKFSNKKSLSVTLDDVITKEMTSSQKKLTLILFFVT